MKKTLEDVQERQSARTEIINSKMPKSWLLRIILVVTPVTAIALKILLSQAVADTKYANKEMVIRHEEKIVAMEQAIKTQAESDQKMLTVLDEILKAVKK